ncbi:hypothetical protein JTB14_018080 [Gonioctena quinquepunctata]|nr:hypothetical protein JTB14_018080 [Gonioctena quinquepunctata]
MNSYYDSDEEVAWGPVTLQEIKGDLKRPLIRKPERRHTIHPRQKMEPTLYQKIIVEPPTLLKNMEAKSMNSSSHDDYHTPNESLRTEASSRNDKYESNQESSAYFTALDTTKKVTSPVVSSVPLDNTHIHFVDAAMNRASCYDIQNFHQTLIEETILNPEQSFEVEYCPDSSTESQEEIIVISSDEDTSEETEFYGDIKREKNSHFADVLWIDEDAAPNEITPDKRAENKSFDAEFRKSDDDIPSDERSCRNLAGEYSPSVSSKEVECVEENAVASTSSHKINNAANESYEKDSKLSLGGQHEIEANYHRNTQNDQSMDKYSCSGFSKEEESIEINSETYICSREANNSAKENYLEKYSNDSLDGDHENEPNYDEVIETHNETDLLKSEHRPRSCNISPVTIPNIDLSQFDESHDAFSQLNDTMEMMERLLNQGNCNDESLDERINKPNGNDEIISGSFLLKPTSSLLNTEHKVSPCKSRAEPKCLRSNLKERPQTVTPYKTKPVDRITPGKSCKSQIPKPVKSPNGDAFKVPSTPLQMKLPSKAYPKTCPNVKNIVSPVGLYIRYSPQPVLKRNVECTKMGTINFPPQAVNHKNKGNLDNIPAVIYKPSKKQIVTSEKEQAIPMSLEKMIKESNLTRHDKKIRQNKNTSIIRRKLEMNMDLTGSSISDSLLDDSNEDVSILHKMGMPYSK